MSIDIQGWGIGRTAEYLAAPGAGHSEESMGMLHTSADQKFSFLQQTEKVISLTCMDQSQIEEFRREVEEFAKRAIFLGKGIRSFWI